jgi:hypothetical protein
MALTDFFRINLPYGVKKDSDGAWFAFNREYKPLGYNDSLTRVEYSSIPIATKYKGLTTNRLKKIIANPKLIHYDDKGEAISAHLYNDATNPQSYPEHWEMYFKQIKELSKLEIK